MVERNLAKVEVESSRLFSRSNFHKKGKQSLPFFVRGMRVFGAVAKRLCPGLQIRLVRFDSGPRLQIRSAAASGDALKAETQAEIVSGVGGWIKFFGLQSNTVKKSYII